MPTSPAAWTTFQARYMTLLAMLHITAIEWRLMIALSESDTPVSEASLALIIHANRTSIRPYVQRGIDAKHLIREKSGILLTENGRRFVEQLKRDLYRISIGRQSGFSLEVLTTIKHLKRTRPEDLRELRTIRFPKPIRMDVTF